MSLCVVAAGKLMTLAAASFTLGWTHSVERVRWEEDWRLTPAGIELVQARVRGSGAGMEPPDGAVLEDGWWSYVPKLPPQPSLTLAASGATGQGWSLCTTQGCLTLGAEPGDPIVLKPCDAQ